MFADTDRSGSLEDFFLRSDANTECLHEINIAVQAHLRNKNNKMRVIITIMRPTVSMTIPITVPNSVEHDNALPNHGKHGKLRSTVEHRLHNSRITVTLISSLGNSVDSVRIETDFPSSSVILVKLKTILVT